jgi:hypothetical protein
VNEFYKENYKELKKEIEEDYRSWKISHAQWLAESNCENDNITKSNLHVQCNSNQNSNGIHHRDWIINLKVHLETQKTENSQGNTKQKEQCWRYHNT